MSSAALRAADDETIACVLTGLVSRAKLWT